MEVNWVVSAADIDRVKHLLESHRDCVLVKRRYLRNLGNDVPFPTRRDIWEAIVACLLTTQQKSGPTSSVTRFLLLKPFPLSLDQCSPDSVAQLAQGCLNAHGGIRRATKIAAEVSANLAYLARGGWAELEEKLQFAHTTRSREAERFVARWIDEKFVGFGPKQSRNLMQKLAISRFEIPIDSRITKWLNDNGFPMALSSSALSDANYYEFVSDGIQELCKASNVYPCVLDAAIFASFDDDGWTDDNAIW